MAATNNARIVQHIRRLAGGCETALTDGELLRRYLAGRDQTAFAELVRRHGAMVFAVCRSVLRRHDDAEDAFQAAFLILSRRAGTIRTPDALSSWLHGVAYRVAQKARAERARRQARETKATPPTEAISASDDLSWGELRTILHAELAALPEHFRTPLVLCYLEGLTQDEAAQRLGCTAATVKGRLQRGREKLRRRLEQRGVALTAALAAALTGKALSAATVKGAHHFTEETATATAKALAGAVLRPLWAFKWVVVSAMLLSVGLVGAGVGIGLPHPAAEETAASTASKPSEQPTPPRAVDGHGDPLPKGAIARLGTIRFNHGDRLNALFFTPDSKTIYSEGNGIIRFWDAVTGKERDRFRTANPDWDNQLVLLPDGKTIVSLNQDSQGDRVRWWDLAHKKETRTLTLPLRRTVGSASHRNALSPDGKLCVCNSHTPAQMQVFDLATGKELYKLTGGDEEGCAVFFAGSDRLITVDKKRGIIVYEARTGKRLRQFGPVPGVEVLAVSTEGRWLAIVEHHMVPFRLMNGDVLSLHERDTIHIWDLNRGVQKHALAARMKRWHYRVHFSPDGELLFASSAGENEPVAVAIWDVATGQFLRELDGAYGRFLAISPDRTRLAEGDDCKFHLWDLKTGRRVSSPDSPHALTQTLSLSPRAERVFTFGDASISTWDCKTGRRLGTFEMPGYSYWDACRSHSFSPDGRYAASFEEREGHLEILLWDIATGRQLHRLRPPGTFAYVNRKVQNATRVYDVPLVTMAFSSDSSLFATWHPDQGPLVRIWDVRTGEQVRSFKQNKADPFGRIFFGPDGKTVVVVAGPHVAGHEVSTGKELFSWSMEAVPSLVPQVTRTPWRALAISPREMILAAVRADEGFHRERIGGRIVLYDARTGKVLRRFSDANPCLRWFDQLAFSEDGALLASSDGDDIHLWEVATGQEVRTFRGHRDAVTYLAFGAEGRHLASGSRDSTVLLWDLIGPPTEERVEQSWQALAGQDARPAYQAVWALARNPERALPLLRERLRPVQPINRERIERWIKDLDSDRFDIREKATAELENCRELAESALRRALALQPKLEQRRRIELILNKLEVSHLDSEALRELRAVRVLEHTDTPAARQLLRELASGAEEARLTRAARAALAQPAR